MQIVFFTSSTNLSGGSRQALYLARGLADRGHAVRFVVPKGAALPDLDPGLEWHFTASDRAHWREGFEAALPDFSPNNPLVFHAFHNRAVKKAAWWGIGMRRRGAVVVGHRGVVFKPNNPLPYWSPGIDAFVVNSEACAKVLRRKGVGQKRLHVVYNGVPLARIEPSRSAEAVREELGLTGAKDETVFVSVTGTNPNKGAAWLIDAFGRADAPGARLVLVGVEPAKFQDTVTAHGLADRVSLVGRTEHVADYLQCAHAFVLSSFSESMPNTLLEAMCMGLPAVATNVGGVPELLRDTGLPVRPGDTDGMAAALSRMARDTDARASMAAASLERARAFSLEHKVAHVERVYRELLATRGLPTD